MHQHLRNIVARDLHFHGANLDFEVVVIDSTRYYGGAADRLQLDGIAFGDMFHELRLGMGISLVGAGSVRDYSRIELFAEFAAQLGVRVTF